MKLDKKFLQTDFCNMFKRNHYLLISKWLQSVNEKMQKRFYLLFERIYKGIQNVRTPTPLEISAVDPAFHMVLVSIKFCKKLYQNSCMQMEC